MDYSSRTVEVCALFTGCFIACSRETYCHWTFSAGFVHPNNRRSAPRPLQRCNSRQQNGASLFRSLSPMPVYQISRFATGYVTLFTQSPQALSNSERQSLLQRIAELESQCRGEKRKVRKLEEEKQVFFRNLIAVFNQDQLASLTRVSNRGSKWSEETIKKALQLHFSCGSTGYTNLLDQKQPLPSSRTLKRRVEGCNTI